MTSDFTIREYRAGDVPALSFLWQDVFGDPLSFTAEFYALLPNMGSAVVAEKDGKLVGAAHVIDGLELVGRRKKAVTAGYIYAVMVAAEYRSLGIGKALTTEIAALAKKRGAGLLCILPADAPLYGWYHRLLGFECVLHRKEFEVGCAARAQVTELDAAQYMQRREQLLQGKNYLRPTIPTMEFQRRFCKFFGGGLYACRRRHLHGGAGRGRLPHQGDHRPRSRGLRHDRGLGGPHAGRKDERLLSPRAGRGILHRRPAGQHPGRLRVEPEL